MIGCVWSVLLVGGAAAGAQAPTTVAARAALTDRAVIESRLRLDPKNNDQREAAVEDMLQKAGCPSVQREKVAHTAVPNVICSVPGAKASEIIVGAHTDKVAAGTGVIDNWSGAALLAALYTSVASQPRRHTFIFIGFSGEEAGLYGSQAYVKANLPTRESVAAVRAVINIDSIGAGPTRIWLSHSQRELANEMARVAFAMHLPVAAWDAGPYYDDDSTPFRERDVPTLMVHSLDNRTITFLHGPGDRMDHFQMADYYDTYRLLAYYLAYLDGLPDQAAGGRGKR